MSSHVLIKELEFSVHYNVVTIRPLCERYYVILDVLRNTSRREQIESSSHKQKRKRIFCFCSNRSEFLLVFSDFGKITIFVQDFSPVISTE